MSAVFEDVRNTISAPRNHYYVHTSAVADLNGDGFQDFIGGPVDFGVDNPQKLILLLGDGNGNFREAAAEVISNGVPSRQQYREIVIADFNGDGRSDVFIACHGLDTASLTMPGERNVLLLSAPGGRLVDATSNLPNVRDFSHSASTGDVDADGDIDLFVGNFQGIGAYTLPYFLVNDGSGRFSLDTTRVPASELTGKFSTGAFNSAIGSSLLADLNRDGRPDLVLGDHGNKLSRVYFNTAGSYSEASSTFLPAVRIFGSNALVLDIVAADFDSDGWTDLVLTGQGKVDGAISLDSYIGRYIQFLRNDGKGGFVDQGSRAFPGGVVEDRTKQTNFFLGPLDLNADGHMDIVVRNAAAAGKDEAVGTPYFWLNDGSGRFRPFDFSLLSSTYDTKSKVIEPIAADSLNGIDFIGANFNWALFRSTATLRTGPGFADPAAVGAPGYNEDFYLNNNADVATAVSLGSISSGLVHYLSSGRAEGRPGFAAGTTVHGSEAADTVTMALRGTVLAGGGNDTVQGSPQNDTISGGAGNDALNGGAGIDTAVFGSGRGAASFARSGSTLVVSTTEGTDSLVGIERLRFADANVAVDLDGNAGHTVKIIGALFGASAVQNKAYVGIGLSLFDGGATLESVLNLAIGARFGTVAPSSSILVDTLFQNLIFREPTVAQKSFYAGLVDSGQLTRAGLAWLAAETEFNTANIGLAGLAAAGIEYL